MALQDNVKRILPSIVHFDNLRKTFVLTHACIMNSEVQHGLGASCVWGIIGTNLIILWILSLSFTIPRPQVDQLETETVKTI